MRASASPSRPLCPCVFHSVFCCSSCAAVRDAASTARRTETGPRLCLCCVLTAYLRKATFFETTAESPVSLHLYLLSHLQGLAVPATGRRLVGPEQHAGVFLQLPPRLREEPGVRVLNSHLSFYSLSSPAASSLPPPVKVGARRASAPPSDPLRESAATRGGHPRTQLALLDKFIARRRQRGRPLACL